MPKVPLPQVRSRPVGAPRVGANPRGAFSSGLAEGLQSIGGAVDAAGDFFAREKAKADAIAVTQAETELQKSINDTLSHREFGVLNNQGTDAIDGADVALETLPKNVETISKKLASDEQREVFRLRADGLVESARRTMETHVSRQIKVVEDRSIEARAAEALNAIALNYADPATRAQQIAAVEGPLLATAVSDEDAALRVNQWRAQAAKVALNAYVGAKDAEGAKAYFAQVKEVLGPDAARFEQQIELLDRDERAEREAIRIVNGSRTEGTGWVDEAAALNGLDSLPAGADKDEVRQRVEHRLRLETRKKNQEIESVYERAFTAYLSGGTLSAIDPRDKAWLIQNSPEDWEKLRNKGRADADRYRSRRSSQETPEQQEAYLELQLELANDPERYANMTAEQFRREWGHRLSDSSFRAGGGALARVQKHVRTSQERGLEVDDKEFRDSVDAEAARAGITRKDEVGQLRLYMQGWLADWRTEHGTKKPTRSDVDKAIADALVEGRIKKSWWVDPKSRRFKAKTGEEFYVEGEEQTRPAAPAPDLQTSANAPISRVADIPSSELQLIRDAAAAKKRTLSDAEILRIYNLKNGVSR